MIVVGRLLLQICFWLVFLSVIRALISSPCGSSLPFHILFMNLVNWSTWNVVSFFSSSTSIESRSRVEFLIPLFSVEISKRIISELYFASSSIILERFRVILNWWLAKILGISSGFVWNVSLVSLRLVIGSYVFLLKIRHIWAKILRGVWRT